MPDATETMRLVDIFCTTNNNNKIFIFDELCLRKVWACIECHNYRHTRRKTDHFLSLTFRLCVHVYGIVWTMAVESWWHRTQYFYFRILVYVLFSYTHCPFFFPPFSDCVSPLFKLLLAYSLSASWSRVYTKTCWFCLTSRRVDSLCVRRL